MALARAARRPRACEGYEPYIFVSYAHDDSDEVYPLISSLMQTGIRVWYDEGVEQDGSLNADISKRLRLCECLIVFMSRHSVKSRYCEAELHIAFEESKTIVPVFLENVAIPDSMRIEIGGSLRHYVGNYESDDALIDKLFDAINNAKRMDNVDSKVDDESHEGSVPAVYEDDERPTHPHGYRHRHRRPRTGTLIGACIALIAFAIAFAHPQLRHVLGKWWPPVDESEKPSLLPETKLEDYSWDDLKIIADYIAEAPTDEEGIERARIYNLVDENGKLTGDTKFLELKCPGSYTDAYVRIIGLRHDERVTRKTDDVSWNTGITFEFTTISNSQMFNETAASKYVWKDSDIRKSLNDDFFTWMPKDLQRTIVKVIKCTNDSGGTEYKTHDRVWLLSSREVYGNTDDNTTANSGSQYMYYHDAGEKDDNSLYEVCTKLGQEQDGYWWLRSLYSTKDDADVCCVNTVGKLEKSSQNIPRGISPCFCM